ncbi:hypothetical protein FLO80_06870 [Aquicoccus porphyridii]|uniref:LysE family translocator n=2 Tax=Aquicoccus porphyridii TaxID=1852029 RepID=A0A5A9ZKK0_9RHOB|nr:hypothetical protein FLO80_06870 [Aquicoccus porphyridii]RAI55812.1 hypothetical protein DOO74_05400 [Rhodobacteraceae bacterium AsT-22]
MEYLGIIMGIAGIHFFAISSPGPTLFVIASHANSDHRRESVFAVLGVVAATALWSGFAVAGLGAVMNTLPWMPVAIRMFGGAYLIWFGYRMLRSVLEVGTGADIDVVAKRVTSAGALRSGFITNISNPKVIAYYVSLFGVMIPEDSPPALLVIACLTAIVVSMLWWGAVAMFFRLPAIRHGFFRLRRVFDGLVGAVLVIFGIRLIAGR